MRKSPGKRFATFICFAVLLALLSLRPVSAGDIGTRLQLSNGVFWVKVSDEYRSCTRQAYDNGRFRLEKLARDKEPGTWCVVFDMDETLVSNISFQKEFLGQQAMGRDFDKNLWNEWCNRAEATLLHGALDFCNRVRELGGRVIIITNRSSEAKLGTIKNLEKLGIHYDALILKEGPYENDHSKSARRRDLAGGTLKIVSDGEPQPSLEILMLAGDQQHDFYDPQEHSLESMIHRFSEDFIILPNPMYGGWTSRTDSYKDMHVAGDDLYLEAVTGQQLTILLDSNPTTGYRWEMAQAVDSAVIRIDEFLFEPSSDGKPGSSGKEVWKFRARGRGETTLHFRYSRPWEKDTPPLKEKMVHIKVK